MAKGGRGRGRSSGRSGSAVAQQVRGAAPGTRAPGNMADAARSGGAEVQPWGLADAINAVSARAGLSNPMPRSALDQVPFGPNWALPPQPLDPARPDTGRPEPRIFEYPVAWNIPGNGNRPVPWDTLYGAANYVDILRRCIEIRKKHLRGMTWGWSVTEEAIAEAMRGDDKAGRDDIESMLREQYLPEIRRMADFWKKPWKANGLSFGQWVNGWMDQHLTLDAVAIYPQMTYGGECTNLEILDASTIKLLLDNRGARPEHPYPAFQQELYGFPRGEFTVSVDDDGQMHGGYAADQLYYHRENFRPNTPYGYSAVEQALISAKLYLKRQGWMLAEYDDGSTPLMWLVPAPTAEMWSQMSADQRRRWEQSLNDEMTGNTARRHRVKVTPPGFQPIPMPSVDERYKPEYDLFLIKMLAGHLGVTVAELGLTEPKGLGSSGYHEGQADVEARVGMRPDTVMVAEAINDLSRDFLRCPPAIEFKFIDPSADDEKVQAEINGQLRARGTITLNDERRKIGMAPLPFEEADMAMLISGDKATPLEGIKAVLDLAAQAQQASLEASNAAMEAQGETADLEAEELEGASAEKALEMAAYQRWHRKRGDRAGRMFICKALDPSDWPGSAVPADVDFEHWEWVPDDAEIVKALGGNDNWRTLARDHRGRWLPRGRMRVDPLGPATPGKEVLSGLQREAAGRRGTASLEQARQRYRDAHRAREAAMLADRVAGLKTDADRERLAAAEAELDAARAELDRAEADNPTPLKPANKLPDVPKELGTVEEEAARLRATEAFLAARYGDGWRDRELPDAHLIAHRRAEARLSRAKRAERESTESHSTSVDTPTTIDAMTSFDTPAPNPNAEMVGATVMFSPHDVLDADPDMPFQRDRQGVVTGTDEYGTLTVLDANTEESVRIGASATRVIAAPAKPARKPKTPKLTAEQRKEQAFRDELVRLAMLNPYEKRSEDAVRADVAGRDAARLGPDIGFMREHLRKHGIDHQTDAQRARQAVPEPAPARVFGDIEQPSAGRVDEMARYHGAESVRGGDEGQRMAEQHRRDNAAAGTDVAASRAGFRRRDERAAELNAGMASALSGGAPAPGSMAERIQRRQEQAVRDTYAELTAANGGNPVALVELRAKLSSVHGLDRGQQDIVLTRLAAQPDVAFFPEENQKVRTAADDVAALHIGGDVKDLISIDKPRGIPWESDSGAPLNDAERAVSRHREAFQAFREGRGTAEALEAARSDMEVSQQPQAFPRAPRNAKPKTEHRVTLPDGTVATRSSQHDYTHAVVTTRDNRAYARHLEAEAQRDRERGFVERAGWREQVAQLNAGPAVTHSAPAFSASLADARTAARKHATPYQTARVVSVDAPSVASANKPAPSAADRAKAKREEAAAFRERVRQSPPMNNTTASAQSVNDAMAAQMAASVAAARGPQHGTVATADIRPGMRLVVGGRNVEVTGPPRRSTSGQAGSWTVPVRDETTGAGGSFRIGSAQSGVPLAAPKAGGGALAADASTFAAIADRLRRAKDDAAARSSVNKLNRAGLEGVARSMGIEPAGMGLAELRGAVVAARGGGERPKAEAPALAAARTGDAALAAAPLSVEGPGVRKIDRPGTAALERYRGKAFTEINRELRAGDVSAANRKTVEQIDRVMGESRLSDQVEVYRGVGDVEAVFGDAARRELVGHEWSDAAPQSTTTDPDIAERFLATAGERRKAAVIKMRVPAGTGAIEMSDARYEAELLLQRGLRMRVVSDTGPWRRGQKRPRTIEVEVIPA